MLSDLIGLFRMLFKMAGPAPINGRIHGHVILFTDRAYDLVPAFKHEMAFPTDHHAFREV
jgi:hypothetical protein